jgi:hypothetical protein
VTHARLTATLLAAAALGASAAAHAAPTWCAADGIDQLSYSHSDIKDATSATDPHDALYAIVAIQCSADTRTTRAADALDHADQIEAARKAWSKRLGMNDADWKDAAVWATHDQGDRNSPTLHLHDHKRAFSAYSPVDQYLLVLKGLPWSSRLETDASYLADIFGDKLTQAGRLGYIQNCLLSELPAEWAMCQHDVETFSVSGLGADLRADTRYDGYEKMSVRIAAAEVEAKLPAHAAAVKQLQERDPGYAKMFALAAGAWQSWRKVDPKLVALAAGMDDAWITNSRRATAGCDEKTWATWSGIVSKIPAKRFGQIHVAEGEMFLPKAAQLIVQDPDGYLASLAFAQCANLSGHSDYVSGVLSGAVGSWPGTRGPRTSAESAILSAGIVLDDRDAKIEAPRVQRGVIAGSGGSTSGGGQGAIASIKRSGDGVTITFKKVKYVNHDCVKGHYTHRVTRIESDGTLDYEYVCEKEVSSTHSAPPYPAQTIKARYATGLKPGMRVSVIDGVVDAAYASARATTPSIVAGVRLK